MINNIKAKGDKINMSNRIGVIFHNDYESFSPLIYSHYGANSLIFEIQNFLRGYYNKYDINDCIDGHKYNSCYMTVGLLQYIENDVHISVENLSYSDIEILESEHEYVNCFDGGVLIINVSNQNFGKVDGDNSYLLKNNNLFSDDILHIEDSCY